ncbi:hypothetical protein IKF81_03135 [Candidatus Saccharibacteria bacterium]|nr:hypothetical protein [Candidatus Saccharibacteria bacterium]
MKYLAVLGRQPKISLAELESLFLNVKEVGGELAFFESEEFPEIRRLGGSLKLAEEIPRGFNAILDYLSSLPEGKIVLGVSDYRKKSEKNRGRMAMMEALKIKKILSRNGRSVRVLENKTGILSTATAHHNQLAEKKNHEEIILTDFGNFRLVGVQNITEYAKRDQVRPARDAKVGMLPPKLAQILINLCGSLPEGSRILDPFCGTGVVLQEAFLDGFRVFGTDLNPRMIEYSRKNLDWILEKTEVELTKKNKCDIMRRYSDFLFSEGDATNFDWEGLLKEKKLDSRENFRGKAEKIDGVATEVFLGQPMSKPPVEIKLKQEKMTCKTIILGFLKNLARQIEKNTPVVLAIPAWLRENGEYSRLNILDEIEELGYNVGSFRNSRQEDLLYHREGQIVAREIIVLRKK